MSEAHAQNRSNSLDADEVRRRMSTGNAGRVLKMAKSLHKRERSLETEALLLDAYVARIRDLRRRGMEPEAGAIAALVRQRFPQAVVLLDEVAAPQSFAAVRALMDPASTSEVRTAAELTLRCSLADPTELADCPLLPPDHPLRRGAAAIMAAFQAVTTGPVDDASLALPEVSHRGPLAPWKPLLRAIACFYRGEDEACERNLAAIDPKSAPARMVPAIRALLGSPPSNRLTQSASALVSKATSGFGELRAALARLDTELHSGDAIKPTIAALQRALSLAQRDCPDLLTELRLQIGIRAIARGLPPGPITKALGGVPPANARACLLLARILELDDGRILEACAVWGAFREAARQEGWFAPEGIESATLDLHIASLAGSIGDAELEIQDGPGVNVGALYARACAIDPHAEAFESWVNWAERAGDGETAAQAWHWALPRDPRPLLRLMRYAQERGALKKALGYLRDAEALDGLSPAVRQGRLDLLLRGAIRHLRQNKPALAAKELAELNTLPQAREKYRAAFVAALGVVKSLLENDDPGIRLASHRVFEVMGGSRASSFMLGAVSGLCGLPVGVALDHMRKGLDSWVDAMARVHGLGADLGFTFNMAEEWRPEIARELDGRGHASAAALEQLARAALRQKWDDIAFAATRMGLANCPGAEAHFLLLRARSLPADQYDRRENCLVAAIQLARPQRDEAAIKEAVEGLRSSNPLAALGGYQVRMSQRRVKKVLNFERSQRELPDESPEDPFEFEEELGFDGEFPGITDDDVPF